MLDVGIELCKFYITCTDIRKAFKQRARSLQIAVALLSRDVYVRRLPAFEKLLDE